MAWAYFGMTEQIFCGKTAKNVTMPLPYITEAD